MTLACEQCGSGWPPQLIRLVPLDGCPECCPEAWRAFGSGNGPPSAFTRDATRSD